MEITDNLVVESSNRGTGMWRPPRLEEAEKHVTYTDEQIELLEKIYVDCPNPTRSQRLQIMQEHPILNGIENRQIKTWFGNCRCRERKKKEKEEFLLINRNLRAINIMMVEENHFLQNEVAQQMQLRENLRNLKAEILKDCPSWFPNCRNLEVLYKLLVNNGTTIEPMYAQRDGQDTWLNGADSLKFPCLMFIVGYQISFSIHLLEDVASMAQPCVYCLILSGKNNYLGATSGSYLVMNSPEANPTMGSMFSPDSVHVVNLANWIGQRSLRGESTSGSVLLNALPWPHQLALHLSSVITFLYL